MQVINSHFINLILSTTSQPLYKMVQHRRHQMETFSVLLALCQGNPPVIGGFPSQRPVTRSFDIFFDMHLNKRLSKQSGRRWFETPYCLLWRRCKAISTSTSTVYWCIASKLKAARNLYWMSNMFLWVETFLFFMCYHVFPKRHSQLDYELNDL